MKKNLLTSILIFCWIYANAQWVKTNSPYSGGVNCFTNSASYLFAGTDSAGTFLSMDNGDTWAIAASGLKNKSVKSITTSGNYIFAGTYDNGVFLSSVQGSSWVPVNSGLSNFNINALITNGPNIFAGTNAGVFISSDKGISWYAINIGLTINIVASLATNGTQIFAGTYGGGVFLSSDTGKSWKAVNNGLSSDSISALVISGSDVFAGTSSTGVFQSSDNGNSWQAVNSGLTNPDVWALVPSGTHLFVATGGGKRGSGTGGGTGGGKGKGGVFISNIAKVAWTSQNTGLPKTDVRSLYIVGPNIFAGTSDSNVWKRPVSELISGIPDLKGSEPGIGIYPNPASNNISIEYSGTSKEAIVVYNELGESVFRDTWLPFETSIHIVDVSGWEKGVYFLRIGDHTEKIIKD